MITVHPFGAYAHRQPLAYPVLRAACEATGRLRLSDRFAEADIVVIAHPRDLDGYDAELARRLRPGQRLVLLSEEPFWDIVWGDDPFAPVQVRETAAGSLTLASLGHLTSTIYGFARIPYFVLTDPRYGHRYARWFARNAALSPADWRERLAAPRHHAAFVAERRHDARFDVAFPGHGVFGLAAVRTRIAEACAGPRTLLAGAGWQQRPQRATLADWHLDKFRMLDGQCRLISAIENTHQRDYITEKPFDALAAGAIPVVIADPDHRLWEIVPEAATLNLHGLGTEAAAARIAGLTLDAVRLEAFAAAQRAMAALFGDPAIIAAERARLAQALAAGLAGVLDAAPAAPPPAAGQAPLRRQLARQAGVIEAQAESLKARFDELRHLTARLERAGHGPAGDGADGAAPAEERRRADRAERAARAHLLLALSTARAARFGPRGRWPWRRGDPFRGSGLPGLEAQLHLVRAAPEFDAAWYLDTYPDVRDAGREPARHYLCFGTYEGRNPGPGFDTLAHYAAHPQAVRDGLCALVHARMAG